MTRLLAAHVAEQQRVAQARREQSKQFEGLQQHLRAVLAQYHQTIAQLNAARHTAEQERLAALTMAHTKGWSLSDIAVATGLSRSRVHQLLQGSGEDQC